MRGFGLAETGNIVVLALDREQGSTANLRRIDLASAMHHLAFRQRLLHEHSIDGLQVEFCREVHHGEIFVIKFAMLLRAIAVALHEMGEQVLVRLDMLSRFMLTKPLSCRKPG